MSFWKKIPTLLFLFIVAGGMVGCATRVAQKSKISIVSEEKFETPSQHERMYPIAAAAACETSQRVLLSQGYSVPVVSARSVEGSKAFQPSHDASIRLDMVVTCLSMNTGVVLYVVAKQTFFELKASSNAADLSLAGMGSISLPVGSTSDSLVKVGEETVSDSRFYERFFELLESKIKLDSAPLLTK